MEYLECKASTATAGIVKRYWSLKQSRAESTTKPDPILPDGCIEIVFDLSDRYLQFFDCGKIELQPRTIIAGQITSRIIVGPTGDTDMFGIRFFPAGASSILKFSLHQVTDQIVDASNIFGKDEAILFERLSENKDFYSRISIVEEFLLSKSRECSIGELDFAIDQIHQSCGSMSISELARSLQCSERRLERRFREYIGISPKMFSRIIRFQSVLREIEKCGSADWLDEIYSAGYYDQSHMIREFKQFSGTTPTEFFSQQHQMNDLFAE